MAFFDVKILSVFWELTIAERLGTSISKTVGESISCHGNPKWSLRLASSCRLPYRLHSHHSLHWDPLELVTGQNPHFLVAKQSHVAHTFSCQILLLQDQLILLQARIYKHCKAVQ